MVPVRYITDFVLELGQRAAQLFSDYLAHCRCIAFPIIDCRNRLELFNNVQTLVREHKRSLEEYDKALDSKYHKISMQCETLIDEVKTGTL
jgi:hypothetical protein